MEVRTIWQLGKNRADSTSCQGSCSLNTNAHVVFSDTLAHSKTSTGSSTSQQHLIFFFALSLPHHVFLYHYLNEAGRDDGLGNITC